MVDSRRWIGASANRELPIVLTVNEVAEALRVRKPVVYAMINRGELRSIRTGHQIRIPYTAFQALLDGSSATPDHQNDIQTMEEATN